MAAGAFVAAVGADNPEKQEIEPALLAGCAVVADVLEQCATIGDLHHAITAGLMRPEDVRAELADIVSARRPGRISSDEIIVFDSTGTALEDVAAAALACVRSVRRIMALDLNPERAKRFARDMTAELDLDVTVIREPGEAARDTGIHAGSGWSRPFLSLIHI